MADARVALALATRALREYAKGAASTQSLQEAQRLLAQLLDQDIDEDPEDGGGPSIRRGAAKDRIVSTTDPEMRHGHKSHSKGFEGFKAAIVVETGSDVILATDLRAGNVHDREGAADRVAQAVESSKLWRLRKQQKTKRFRKRYRKRVVVEHRIGRASRRMRG